MFANKGLLQNCIGLMFTNNGLLQNCMGPMFTNKALRQLSKSTSPRRDPKRKCRRSVCAKRAPQCVTADKHLRVIRSMVAPRRGAPPIVACKGAFGANAPTTFTAMPKNVFLSMFANKSPMQNCMEPMSANKTLRRGRCRLVLYCYFCRVFLI